MASPSVRPAAVAGAFYDADASRLQADLTALLAAARPLDRPARMPKALVVPHAGYIYSGPVAASAYAALAPWRDQYRRVLLLGPAHRVLIHGAALPDSGSFATPLGPLPLDLEACAALRRLPGVEVSAAAHAREHSLEVQLPFLHAALAPVEIVPLVVGHMASEVLATIIEAAWGGPETLIVVSTDLSHYLPYADARRVDQATCQRILALGSGIDHDMACGATPLNGFLALARKRGLRPRLLDLRNSGDTSGERGQVVGYASFSFEEEDTGAIH